MLENLGLAAALIGVLAGGFLIYDAGTGNSSQFELLAGAFILTLGLITGLLIGRSKLEWLRTLKKYRQG